MSKEQYRLYSDHESSNWSAKLINGTLMRSRLEPMKMTAGMLGSHKALIRNCFDPSGQVPQGAVEELNKGRRANIEDAGSFRKPELADRFR